MILRVNFKLILIGSLFWTLGWLPNAFGALPEASLRRIYILASGESFEASVFDIQRLASLRELRNCIEEMSAKNLQIWPRALRDRETWVAEDLIEKFAFEESLIMKQAGLRTPVLFWLYYDLPKDRAKAQENLRRIANWIHDAVNAASSSPNYRQGGSPETLARDIALALALAKLQILRIGFEQESIKQSGYAGLTAFLLGFIGSGVMNSLKIPGSVEVLHGAILSLVTTVMPAVVELHGLFRPMSAFQRLRARWSFHRALKVGLLKKDVVAVCKTLLGESADAFVAPDPQVRAITSAELEAEMEIDENQSAFETDASAQSSAVSPAGARPESGKSTPR